MRLMNQWSLKARPDQGGLGMVGHPPRGIDHVHEARPPHPLAVSLLMAFPVRFDGFLDRGELLLYAPRRHGARRGAARHAYEREDGEKVDEERSNRAFHTPLPFEMIAM